MIELQLSGPLSGAGNLAAYHLMSGKIRKNVTTFSKPVPLVSAVYNPATLTVTLTPATKLNLSQPGQLRITAADLADAEGRPLDGDPGGPPGSDFVAILSKKGITSSAVQRNPVPGTKP